MQPILTKGIDIEMHGHVSQMTRVPGESHQRWGRAIEPKKLEPHVHKDWMDHDFTKTPWNVHPDCAGVLKDETNIEFHDMRGFEEPT